ncbi:MAG TPA: hypothetical protein VGN06_12100 [Gaiellaceae bacterium]|jgi:hypothetical protein
MSGRATVGVAAGLAAIAATAGLAFTHGSSASSTLGPEGVPIPTAPPLTRSTRPVGIGERVDGIACQAHEQVLFHIHAHLTIFVRGRARQVPAGIGIGAPYEVLETRAGAFVAGATCFMWLHTHSADGIIHTESPIRRTYTLGDFFDIWGQPLGPDRVGPARGRVAVFVAGRRYEGDPRSVPLLAHAQIQLDVGAPPVAPERIAFPPGL